MEGDPSVSSDDHKLITDSVDVTKPLLNDGSSQRTSKSIFGRICDLPLCALCNPHLSSHGYVIVLLLCVARFGIVFCIDNPAPLESAILGVMRVDITRYELLYAVYAWPNAIVPLLGGILIDKLIGLRAGFILFITIACTGQFLVALAVYLNWFWLMVVGRLIFGGGGEIAALCVDIFAAALFKEKKLSFVFGLVYSSGRLGSVLNINLSGQLYSSLAFITNNNARLGCVFLLGFALIINSSRYCFWFGSSHAGL